MTRTRLWRRSLVLGLALVVVLAAVLWFTPSDHYLFLPDPARPVDELVKIPGESDDPRDGGIYMVDILVRRATLFDRLFPQVNSGATLVPERVFNPAGVSDDERRQQSLNEMSASQQVAVAVALRSLGHDVEQEGAEVVDIQEGAPADGPLEVGDVIVEASGRAVRSPEDLRRALRALEPGSSVELTIRRDGEALELEVGTRAAEDDPQRAILGVIVQPQLDLPVDVRIDAGSIGGPSAGLAFALNVVDELGRDIDRGRRVAVTGTLDLDGTVGEIGGIKQKTIGAREAEADLFLVPEENVDEARRHAEGLEIVPVGSFREALSELQTE